MQPVKGIVFDKDGTLFGFHETWSPWFRKLADDLAEGDHARARLLSEQIGFAYDEVRFLPSSPFISGTPELLEAIACAVFSERPRLEIVNQITVAAKMAAQVEVVRLKPLFEELRSSVLYLGVATNDDVESARSHLASADILDSLDFVAGFNSGYDPKPAPSMLLAFCEACRVEPRSCMMVGDSLDDLTAARRAGMPAIGVLTGVADENTLRAQAVDVLSDIGQLPGWLACRRNSAPSPV